MAISVFLSANIPRTVADILKASIWWTVALQFPAIIVGWLIGNTLGALAAYVKKGFDKVLMPVSILVSNFPAFGMAVILLVIFGVDLKWFPTSGGYGFDLIPNLTWAFVWSVIVHYQLPFWSIVLITIGGQAIGMRSMSIYELNADYVKYARFLGDQGQKNRRLCISKCDASPDHRSGVVDRHHDGRRIGCGDHLQLSGAWLHDLEQCPGQDYPLISAATIDHHPHGVDRKLPHRNLIRGD